MAINIIGGRKNSIYAKQSVPISSLGLNTSNTNIIVIIDAIIVSYKPGRLINGLTTIEEGKSYLIDAKTDLDLEEIFYPPFFMNWSDDPDW